MVLFNPKLPRLSKNEQEVLELLIEAGKLITPIYKLQEKSESPGANFYPSDVTREEIEKAAKKDPLILSPYTIVEKHGDKLITIPYHKKYATLLKPIVDKLNEAAELTDNKEFSKRLKVQAASLLNGNYDEAAIAWMSMKPYVLDINIGPVERYDDKLFFTKTAYQSWVGVMDVEATEKANKYKDIVLSARRRALMPSEKVDYYDKVQIRVDDLLLLSGLIARTLFVGVNLPNDPGLMEKYGSEITIFKQTNEIRHEKNLKILNSLFAPEFRKQFTNEDLETGGIYFTAMHELAHVFLRYYNSEKRLQDLFPVIDELGATVMGIKVSGSLLLKDIISQKQLESMMVIFITRSLNLILNEASDQSKYHYTLGGAIFLNYLLESGAVRETGGISWPNFTKMFVSIDELSEILERTLSLGSRADAESLIKRYGNPQKIQSLTQLPRRSI